jgi:hypothetical protein
MKKLVLIALLNAGIVVGQGDLRNKINITYPKKNNLPKHTKNTETKNSNEVKVKSINLKRSRYYDEFFYKILDVDTLVKCGCNDNKTFVPNERILTGVGFKISPKSEVLKKIEMDSIVFTSKNFDVKKYRFFKNGCSYNYIPDFFKNDAVDLVEKAKNFYLLYKERIKFKEVPCTSLLWYELLKKKEVDLDYFIKNKKLPDLFHYCTINKVTGETKKVYDYKKMNVDTFSLANDFIKAALKYKVDIKNGVEIGDYISMILGIGNKVVDTSLYWYGRGFLPNGELLEEYGTVGGGDEGHIIKVIGKDTKNGLDFVYGISFHIDEKKGVYYRYTTLVIDYEKELIGVMANNWLYLQAITFKSANYFVLRIK